MKQSISPDNQTPAGSLRRSENSSNSLSNSLYPNLGNDSRTQATENGVQSDTPRQSIQSNGETKKSPQLSTIMPPDAPRLSILRNGEINNNKRNSNKGGTPRPSVVIMDETSIKKHEPDSTPEQSVNEETDRTSLAPSSSSTIIGRSSSLNVNRPRPSSISRQSILRIGDIEGHNGNRLYNIFMDFLIFCVTFCEVAVVLLLAILHFSHEEGLMAITMLLPIVLNCVGVVYFLSDKTERLEMEKAARVTCLTDFLQFPVLGPVFTAFKVLTITCGCSKYNNYERMEAIAVKLRQAGGFFSAAPETMIILTVMFSVEQDENSSLTPIQYLEIGAAILFTFTLAESNCYGSLSNYYKMWTDHESHDWKLRNVYLWQKLMLFLHSFTSIASKMIASAAMKSAVLYYWKGEDFVVVLTAVVFAEVGIRVVLHYICRQLKFLIRDHQVPSSCYESINYGWRASILNYSFLSQNLFVQITFYIENFLCFAFWTVSAVNYADHWVEELLLPPTIILFNAVTFLSIILLISCSCLSLIKVHGPFARSKPMSEAAKSRIIIEFARSTSVP